jgi:regulator-associated protein of mTOR
MRTASGHSHPNPLASHAPPSTETMNGDAAPPRRQGRQDSQVTSASRPSSSAAANASPNSDDMDESTTIARRASMGAQSGRPGLMRARSDFGPRHSVHPPESVDEGSTDGQFKIRHGWDDQLNSEEYSNLLTSVG